MTFYDTKRMIPRGFDSSQTSVTRLYFTAYFAVLLSVSSLWASGEYPRIIWSTWIMGFVFVRSGYETKHQRSDIITSSRLISMMFDSIQYHPRNNNFIVVYDTPIALRSQYFWKCKSSLKCSPNLSSVAQISTKLHPFKVALPMLHKTLTFQNIDKNNC